MYHINALDYSASCVDNFAVNGRRTCVVDEVRVSSVADDDGHQVRLGDVELAQLEEGGARLGVVVPQEALQVLQARCNSTGRGGARSDSCASGLDLHTLQAYSGGTRHGTQGRLRG